jgi:serine/threonine protein kinase
LSHSGWEVVEVAASGTFGTVCVATDLSTGALHAIKVLRGEHLKRPRVLARAKDEAAMLLELRHPGIVRVYDLALVEGRPLLVMEWVRGHSVEQLIAAHGPLPVGPALRIAAAVADALKAAWEQRSPATGNPLRVIHRDLKPSNLLVSVDGDVKIVDFGIAHAEIAGKTASTMSVVLGARGYLAPERLDGHDDHPSSDTYSLGVCLLEMLTGRHPNLSLHRGHHDEALERNLAAVRVSGIGAAELVSLRALVARLCAYDPASRPTHAETSLLLERWLARSGVESSLPRWADALVWPMFQTRPRTALLDHPDHADLAFLDRSLKPGAHRAPPDVDGRIADTLASGAWVDEPGALLRLLALNPHASPQPFLAALPEAPGLWARLAGTPPSEVRRVVALLRILTRWTTPAVRRRAAALARHPDPAISEAARRFQQEGA